MNGAMRDSSLPMTAVCTPALLPLMQNPCLNQMGMDDAEAASQFLPWINPVDSPLGVYALEGGP
jgi:hypothetical protein